MSTPEIIDGSVVPTRGLTYDKQSGRWRITCRDHSMTYFYRAVIEAKLRRPLDRTEHVHHINGDCSDDRPENLELLDIREHGALHAPEALAARRANRRFAWSRDYPRCVECSTDTDPYFASGQCRRCYHRNYMRARRAAQMETTA
jgi:NADH pyrophosphatase NudC (nudix superfamily)